MKMARQVNILENGSIVVDLTTDDCNDTILHKMPVNSGDNDVKTKLVTLVDVNDTEDDVEFLGRCVRYIPVITISDSDVSEDDNINNTDTGSHTLKANSTITVKKLSEQSAGCRTLKGKSCFFEKAELQQTESVRTSNNTKQAVAETVMGSACGKKRHHIESSTHNTQAQNIKKEILTEAGSSQNKIYKCDMRNGSEKYGTKVHRKKPKIKVRIVLKKPGSDTSVTDKVKTEDSRSHKAYCSTAGVTRKGIQDVSGETVNVGILTQSQLPDSKSAVNKGYLDLKNKYCFDQFINTVNLSKEHTITKSIAGGSIGEYVGDTNKNTSKIECSSPWPQTKGNCGHEDIRRVKEMHVKSSGEHPEGSSNVCSQLPICTLRPLHNTQDERDGSPNENIKAVMADEQKVDNALDVQVLPARMTIKDCESQVVYAVPLLRLPVQKQVVYFSPEYIEAFLKTVRDVFNVEKFLRAIPDPFNYFRKEIIKERRYSEECLALMYLKSKFRRIPFPDIAFVYEKNRFGITLTCEELDMWRSSQRRTNRRIGIGCGCPKPHELSMRFVHEVTFIENKNIIERHLRSKKKKKETALELARLSGELQQCGHCGVYDLLAEDMAPCSMFHMFCKICIQNAVDTRLRRCENPFSCLNKGCQWLFSMEELKKAVKPVTFSCLLHICHLKEMEAAGVRLLETCPYCGFADIPSRNDEVFCCLNLDCMKETCRQCKGPSHPAYPCVMALRPQAKMPLLLTNRYDQYQNQSQNTETQQNIGIVEEKSLVLQQPQPLMQYPQQPLTYQQPLMFHPQEPLMHHQQPFMHYPQQPPVHDLQPPATQQSCLPFVPEQQMVQRYQSAQWRY